jgi:hypothetical protein
MNTEKDIYSELINRIKVSQPTISDPQGLTSATMQRIEHLSKKKNDSKILHIMSLTSSIAASLLIGLFVFEQFTPPTNTETNTSTAMPVYNVSICSINDYIEFMQIKKERQKLYSNLINKYKNL